MSYKILILDDAIDKLVSHIEFLEYKYFNITKLKDISEALNVCEKEIDTYDCIIIDVKMVFEDEQRAGINFAKKLIYEFKFQKPIIFFTVLAEDNDHNILELLKLPNVFHIQKGVTVTKFYEYIIEKFENFKINTKNKYKDK
jgi:CheY-like chemotaxis protein